MKSSDTYATTPRFRANSLHWPPHRAKRKIIDKSNNKNKTDQSICNPNLKKNRSKNTSRITRTNSRISTQGTRTNSTKHYHHVTKNLIPLISHLVILVALASCQEQQQLLHLQQNLQLPSVTSDLNHGPFRPMISNNLKATTEQQDFLRLMQNTQTRQQQQQSFTKPATNARVEEISIRDPSSSTDLRGLPSQTRARESRTIMQQTGLNGTSEHLVATINQSSNNNYLNNNNNNNNDHYHHQAGNSFKPTSVSSLARSPRDQLKYTYTDAVGSPGQDDGNSILSGRSHRPPMVTRYQANRRPNSRPNTVRPHHNGNQVTFGTQRPRWGRNNIYKRVLLCDKTLISLDYLKKEKPPKVSSWSDEHFALESPESGGWNDDPFEGGIDTSGFEDFFDNSMATANQSVEAMHSRSTSPQGSLNRQQHHRRHVREKPEPEWLLPDNDPLVLCDMWDLEKGLLNRKPPESLLAMAVKADFNTVREAIKRCRQLSERALPIEHTNEYRDSAVEISTEDMISMYSIKRGLIPGTKWCGLGDIAATYNDLGQKRRIDICCRAHDHCPIRLKPFRNDYGLFNIALYTKSHCECDTDFYRCLREVRSKTADMLGNLYFNVMKLQCLHEEPMKMCRELRPLALGFERCVKYEQSVNKTQFRFSAPPQPY